MNARALRFTVAAALVMAALLPPLSQFWQARLITHLLVQYPLLIIAGATAGAALARSRETHWTAAPALLCAAFALGFWMLPRWIDAAVESGALDLLKAGCLFALVGLPLGWGWALAGPILRGFVWANVISMLGVMGWLQLAIPARLCNSYLLADQRQLGLALLMLAGMMLAAAFGWAMQGHKRTCNEITAQT